MNIHHNHANLRVHNVPWKSIYCLTWKDEDVLYRDEGVEGRLARPLVQPVVEPRGGGDEGQLEAGVAEVLLLEEELHLAHQLLVVDQRVLKCYRHS